MGKKLRILCDMDGVLENLSEVWVDSLNRKFGKNVKYEDIREWDLMKAYPDLSYDEFISVAFEDGFYQRLKPIDGARETLERLKNEGHEILIVTSTDYRVVKVKMEDVLFKYFPFITWRDVTLTWHKQYLKGDVLIDDAVHNFIGGDYKKLLFSAPYNEDFDAESAGITRVYNWSEVYDEIEKLARE